MKKSEFLKFVREIVEEVRKQKPSRPQVYLALAAQYAQRKGLIGVVPDDNPVVRLVASFAAARVDMYAGMGPKDKNPTITWEALTLIEEAWEYFQEEEKRTYSGPVGDIA